MRRLGTIVASIAIVALAGCGTTGGSGGSNGRAFRIDRSGDEYAITARDARRDAVLSELERVANVEIRPHPGGDGRLSIDVRGLALDDVIARLMPNDARYSVRYGKRDVESTAALREGRKQGAALAADARLPRKDDKRPAVPAAGIRKPAPESSPVETPVGGPRGKPVTTDLVQMATAREPKKAPPRTVPRDTVRITLLFEPNAAPRIVRAQLIEGRAPLQRMVTGPFLFVLVGADGRPVHYGTFLDPLLQHSYLPEGQHDVGRSTSGTIGISIDRERMTGGRVIVYDARDVPLPRELSDESVRALVGRAKPVVEIDVERINRLLGEEIRK